MNSNLNDKIPVYLESESDMLGKFYSPEDYNLSNELEEYIIKEVSRKYKNEKIKIYVEFKEEGNVEKFKKAIYNTFVKKMKSVQHDIRKNNIVSLVELIIGIVLGVLVYMLSGINNGLSQLVSIACWVFIWYSVETYFFVNRELKLEKIRYNQIIIAEITTEVKI